MKLLTFAILLVLFMSSCLATSSDLDVLTKTQADKDTAIAEATIELVQGTIAPEQYMGRVSDAEAKRKTTFDGRQTDWTKLTLAISGIASVITGAGMVVLNQIRNNSSPARVEAVIEDRAAGKPA